MKRKIAVLLCAVLMVMVCASLAACNKAEKAENLWDNATYTEDTEFGNGSKTLTVEVEAKDKTVTFTINTDKETVGEALLEHQLVEGEEGAYGLYVKVVNGIEADYNKTNSYWAICKDDESLMTGVDGETISETSIYKFVYTES